MALQAANLPMDTRDKERNPRQMMASCLSKLHSDPMFTIALIRLWAPTPAPEPSPGLPRLRDTPRHSSGAGPETPCFLFQHVYPIRLLEAAELLEADQRKHEGGHSKETSSKGFH